VSGTAADVISVAKSFLGTSDGAQFFAVFGEPDRGPYCVAYVRAVMKLAGVGFPWHTWYAWDYGDAPNPIAPRDFQMADGVSFDWPDDEGQRDGKGDHVGIFERFETRDGVEGFWSYEGNTSGGIVDYKWRPLSCAICGIRPSFAESGGEWRKSGERWWWAYPDDSWPANEWKHINGHWYYFDAQGWMVTGWVHWGDAWYWCDKTKGSTEGQMLASTCIHDGTGWYALGSSGAMLTDVQTNPEHDGTYGRLLL